MGRYSSGSENDLLTIIKDLQKRIQQLEQGQRIGNTSIDKGALRIKSGNLVVGDPALVAGGYTAFYGLVGYGGDFSPGWIFKRADGSIVFSLAGNTADTQGWEFRDRDGHLIFSEDRSSGAGLAKPWLPIPFYESAGWALSTSPGTTSGTMTALWTGRVTCTHPKVYVRALVQCTDVSTAGEFDLRNTGTGALVDSSPVKTTSGTALNVVTWTDYHLSDINSEIEFEIRARRTSGAGTVYVRPAGAFMRQS